MKVQLIYCSILLVSLLSFADAANLYMDNLQKNVDAYNRAADQAPVVLRLLLANEQINMQIIKGDGSIFLAGLDVVNSRIERVVEGGWPDPTITIITTDSAISNIMHSDDPVRSFQEERSLGQFRIESKDWFARAKIEAVLSSASVLQFGYELFFG